MIYYFIFLFLNQLSLIYSTIPNWNIDNLSVELYSPSSSQSTYNYILYNSDGFVLTKIITRNADGTLTVKNELTYNSVTKVVEFDGIQNIYYNELRSAVLICPKGSFHPYEFYYDYYIKPFDYEGNWELNCLKHGTGYFLVFYIHNGNNGLYYVEGNNRNFKRSTSFDELYGYQFYEKDNKGHNYKYDLPSLQKRGNDLVVSGYSLTMNPGENNVNGNGVNGQSTLTQVKSDTYGSIDSNYNFYFFTYNNVSDFISGYSNTYMHTGNEMYANSFSITSNSDSPLNFVDNVEIKEIKFVPGSKNIYYKIYNKDKGTTYYGLIDVKINKVIYNLEGDDDTIFIPDTTGNMLAITSTSMYRVCFAKSSSGDYCENIGSETCTNIILDPERNKCQDACDEDKIQLMPEGFCIKKNLCDLNIYILNEDETKCGLCSYFYPDGAKYKLINTSICLSEIPDNVEYYNQQWNLYKCKENYHLDNNQCKPDSCYERCEACNEVSNDITNQKCKSCKEDYKLDNGNCIIPPSTIINIPSTFSKVPSTIPLLPEAPTTNIITPTTVINIQSTLVVTPQLICEEKCLTCNEESNKKGLCLSCNEAKGYKKVNYTIVLTEFLNCIKKEDPKFINFYFNETLQEYRPCYKTCKKCLKSGNPEAQHCLECKTGYMFRPNNNPFNNCIAYSEFHYYTSSYNQYKSLNIYQCPEEAKYYIKEKKSCIDDCQKDNIYNFLYNGNCLKECPDGTHNTNFICIVNNNNCNLGKNDIYLAEKDNLEVIGTLVKSYISEFTYTNKYVSLYQNKNYTIIIYKDTNCISELSLEFPEVDFQSCYTKVQQKYGITEQLIIVIVDKKSVKIPSTFYSFYHPLSGSKLDAENICKNETIVVLESLISVLSKNDTYYEAQTSLTSQGINIFDLNDPFYTDICYDYENPLKKDIPLNDRIKYIYPNVALCDEGCEYKSINLDDMTSTCDCKFNDISNNNAIQDNELMNEAFGEIFDIINSSNILVFKCIKYIFKHFSRSIGAWISLTLIISHLSMTAIYFLFQSIKVKKYMFTLTKRQRVIYHIFQTTIGKKVPILQKEVLETKAKMINIHIYK